jgi:hypothetical protein
MKINPALRPVDGLSALNFPSRLLSLRHRPAAVGNPPTRVKIMRLSRDQVIRLDQSSRIKNLTVKSGIIWLTGAPANGDILLHPGDLMKLPGHWPYVIQALDCAEVQLGYSAVDLS